MKILLSFFLVLFLGNVMAASDPQAAYKMVKEGSAVMVDVRERDEIKSGMIEEAVWFPKSKMSSDTDWKNDFLKLTKGKKIFLYCRTGRRSGESQELLKKNGIGSENIGGYEQLKTTLPTTIPK